jgi:hypothetical protein
LGTILAVVDGYSTGHAAITSIIEIGNALSTVNSIFHARLAATIAIGNG